MVSAAEQLALAKAKQLKKRIWLTLAALLVYQLGTFIPLPGMDPAVWDQFFQTNAGRASIMFD